MFVAQKDVASALMKHIEHARHVQKMICEAMGTAEDLVVAGVNSQFGQQVSPTSCERVL